MAAGSEHLSRSDVQTRAEAEIVEALAAELKIELVQKPPDIQLAGGVHIEVDAATPDGTTVVEAYARQGTLMGGQLKKIAEDILKLALLKKEPGREGTTAIIVFASQEAHDSISGWVLQAAKTFGVWLLVVDISSKLRDEILRAQGHQVMVNIDQVADDVALES
jgi:hypothetical protein